MLYYLAGLAEQLQFLNVFRYITFRTGGALITSAHIVFLFGPRIICSLRGRQGRGQAIRGGGLVARLEHHDEARDGSRHGAARRMAGRVSARLASGCGPAAGVVGTRSRCGKVRRSTPKFQLPTRHGSETSFTKVSGYMVNTVPRRRRRCRGRSSHPWIFGCGSSRSCAAGCSR